MRHMPHSAMLEVASHLTKDVLVLFAAPERSEDRHSEISEPICLNDASLTEHYGHRHYDVDVERI